MLAVVETCREFGCLPAVTQVAIVTGVALAFVAFLWYLITLSR